ncbi:MAG: Bro-N domain-containing protein [Bacteroidales bacterium]|nr:Bro-N domain-containing protein [Bacteroidales bacterium]
MKKIKTFSHPTLGDIRTMTDERGEPWFVGKDVAERLGYSNTRDAVRKHVDEEDKTTVAICDDGSNYKSMTVLINESGLYSLILSSKLHQSKGFLWRKGCQVSWVSGVKVIFHVLHSPQFARHNSLVSLWGRNKGRNLEFNGQEIVRMGFEFLQRAPQY